MRVALLVSFFLPTCLAAGPKVEIVVAEKAPGLEKRAADEIAALLKRLYQAEATELATASRSVPAIFIGSPATNPALDFAKADWPKLNDQGHIVKSMKHRDQPALVIGGGSPVATYWAACEYAHHLGVRSMLYGDLDPIAPPEFSLAGINLKSEASLSIRGWEIEYESPTSFGAWTKEEQVALIRQLAKLKFNRLVLRVRAGEPFIHFEAAGIRRKEGKFWDRESFPVDGDTAGRSTFGGAKFFDNPDLAKLKTEEERIAASKAMLHAVIAEARSLGMQTVFHIEPYDLPPEYDRRRVYEDAALAKQCAQSTVRAFLHTYPTIDAVMIGIHSHYEHTHEFFDDPKLWRRPDGSNVALLNYSGEPVASRKQPKSVTGSREVVFGGVTSAVAMLNWDNVFERPKSPAIACRELPFTSISTPPLPQIAHTAIVAVADQLQQQRWDGYVVDVDSSFGCLDLSAYLLSRKSFGSQITTEKACDDLLTPICGEEVYSRVARAFDMVESATRKLELESRYLELESTGIWKAYTDGASPPDRWQATRDAYLNAMNEMYRANTRAREGSRSYTLYLARQFEFGFEYMNCLQAVRNAGVAKKAGDKEKQIAELEKAIDSINSACNALAAVARSNSDRGLIAVLNVEIYRPLVKELEKADAE